MINMGVTWDHTNIGCFPGTALIVLGVSSSEAGWDQSHRRWMAFEDSRVAVKQCTQMYPINVNIFFYLVQMIQRWWAQTSRKPEPIWIVTYRKFCEFRRFRSCALSHVLLCIYVLYLHSFTASNDNFGFLKWGYHGVPPVIIHFKFGLSIHKPSIFWDPPNPLGWLRSSRDFLQGFQEGFLGDCQARPQLSDEDGFLDMGMGRRLLSMITHLPNIY